MQLPSLPKQMKDIESTVLLDPEWYLLRVVREPTLEPNRKKRDELSYDEGAGYNLVLRLRTVTDDPSTNGRSFTKWIPWPVNGDAEPLSEDDGDGDAVAFDEYRGKPKVDAKLENLRDYTAIMKGIGVEDVAEIDIAVGDEAYFLVVQQPSFRDPETMENSLDMNAMPKPA